MAVVELVVRFFQQGGAFMYPIALVLLMVIAVSVERLVFLLRTERQNRALLAELAPLMQQGDLTAIDSLLKPSWPMASIAVMTDWCEVLASAWMTMVRSVSVPACCRMASLRLARSLRTRALSPT